jgi:cell division topological specificity factor
MIDWVKKMFGGPTSSSTAKERLRLVLMTDHLALAPDIIENMKRDLIDVISRYVEVDRDKVEVNFEREDRALAMLANIPIVSVNRPSPPPQPPAQSGPPSRRRRRKKPPAQSPATAHSMDAQTLVRYNSGKMRSC